MNRASLSCLVPWKRACVYCLGISHLFSLIRRSHNQVLGYLCRVKVLHIGLTEISGRVEVFRIFHLTKLHFPYLGASNEFSQILSNTVSILSMVPDLCTSQAICDILPIILRLVSCVFEEAASYEVPLVEASQTVVGPKMPHVVSSTLKALKELVGSQRLIQSEYSKEFIRYFQR